MAVLLLFFLALGLACAPSPAAQPRPGGKQARVSARVLDRLIRERRYPEFEEQLRSADLKASQRLYFEGILADRTNRVALAVADLNQVLPLLRRTNPHRAAMATRALADDYFLLGRYSEAAASCRELLGRFPTQFDATEKQTIGNNRHTFALFRGAPPQTISGARTFVAPLRRDPFGDLEVPLRIGAATEWWIFDTGANESVISASAAKKLGLKISKGRASARAATGIEVPLHGAVIPQVKLGSATIHNIAVLVLKDSALDMNLGKGRHYQIRGILGYPVLRVLGSFTISANEMKIRAEGRPSAESTKLYVDELTPLLEVAIAGHALLVGLDTGDTSANLGAEYFHEFPRQFASLKMFQSRSEGAGGSRLLSSYRLPRLTVRLGAAAVTLKNVTVYTSNQAGAPLQRVFGNFGQGFLDQFSSYTIDFKRMRFSVRKISR